ncbi:YidB family protein [Undibacterium arcticum]|uniref:YidB family protein n=1 Tax=Undibacterium arcticum TaxID=1762892 RepID=A0ABV7EVU0_9BURK
MGLLDMALGMLGGGQEGQQNDPKSMLLQAALAMLANSSQGGGLQGVLGAFRNAGLGNAVNSWVGTGENQPISADQVQQALGDGQLQQLADAAGLSHDSAAGHLADMLPNLINQLTPNGQLPEGGLGDISGMLGKLMGGKS